MRQLAGVLAGCICVALSSVASADSWEQVSARGVLRIGTTGDYAPYSWRDAATGEYRGADIALARGIALELGLRAQFVPTTWPALVADAQAGKFDIAVGGVSITPERARTLLFSRAYTQDSKQPVVRCGEERRYDSRREIDQPGVRLVVNPGGTNERFARQQFPHATLIVHADNRTVFDEILAQRADVMVTDSVEGRLQQHAGTGLCMARVQGHWAPAKKAVMLVNDTELRHRVDHALVRLGGAGSYRRWLADWERYSWSVAGDPATQLAVLIDARLAIVTEVARSKWNTKSAIEDPPREQALLESLRARAVPLGLSAEVVNRFFGAQIEAARLLQTERFALWQREHHGSLAGVADLARDIRPQIDQVTTQMLELLARMPKGQTATLPAASTMAAVSPAAVTRARAPQLAVPGT